MKALVISDLHFGAWTGDALLSREFALSRLAPHLDDVDELILLGDVFDFMFSTIENAFREADPFFDLIQEKLQGKRLVYLAGNHDHHIVVRTLRSFIETRVATGADGDELTHIFEAEYRNFFQRYLERRLPGVESETVYPVYTFGRMLLCHGHYLDAHMQGSLPNRLLTRAIWSVAGGRPPESLTVEDYEAVIVPLTELFFTVAQMPRGLAAQQGFYNQFERLSQALRFLTIAQGTLARLKSALAAAGNRLLGGGADTDAGAESRMIADATRRSSLSATIQLAGAQLQEGIITRRGESGLRELTRSFSVSGPVPLALSAYGQVVRNLGWDMETATMIFGHTHQPLEGVFDPASGPVRFWNTGSWVYEPTLGSKDAYVRYLQRAWPGTGIVIDTEQAEPRLVHMLADQNPLHGGTPAPGLRRPADQFTRRAGMYDARLRNPRRGRPAWARSRPRPSAS